MKYILCINTKLLGLTHYILNIKYMNTVLIASLIYCGQFRYIKMKLSLQGQDYFIQEMEILWFVHFSVFIKDRPPYPYSTHRAGPITLVSPFIRCCQTEGVSNISGIHFPGGGVIFRILFHNWIFISGITPYHWIFISDLIPSEWNPKNQTSFVIEFIHNSTNYWM